MLWPQRAFSARYGSLWFCQGYCLPWRQSPLSTTPRRQQLALGRSKSARMAAILSRTAAFFWLGDTTWSIVNQYTKEEAEFYLEYRRKQGFTVEHVMPLFDGGPGIKTSSGSAAREETFL